MWARAVVEVLVTVGGGVGGGGAAAADSGGGGGRAAAAEQRLWEALWRTAGTPPELSMLGWLESSSLYLAASSLGSPSPAQEKRSAMHKSERCACCMTTRVAARARCCVRA
jgi:hypothetical protein